jgi:hypothetical protein
MGRSRSVPIPLSQSRSVPLTLQPNKKQNRSVPDYQTQNRAAPFLESGMERLRSTWLLNQTLSKLSKPSPTSRFVETECVANVSRFIMSKISSHEEHRARRCWHGIISHEAARFGPRAEKPAPPLAGHNGRNRLLRRACLLTKAGRRRAAWEAILSDHPSLRPSTALLLTHAHALTGGPPPPRWPRPRWGARRRPPTGPSSGGGGGRGRGSRGTARRPPRVCWRRRTSRKGRRPSRRPGAGGEGARWRRSPRSWRRGPPRSRRCPARRASGTTARRRRRPSIGSWLMPSTPMTPSGSEVLQLNSHTATRDLLFTSMLAVS